MSENKLTNKQLEFVGLELSVQDIASMIKSVEDHIAEYLYERYYLENNIHSGKLKDINKRFNVKVFIISDDFELDNIALEHIETELADWKRVSDGNAILPFFININLSDYSEMTDEAAGLLKPIDKSIHLKDSVSVKNTFRHEMMHLNDLNFYDIIDVRKSALKWREELINAGITQENADYAYENKLEFVAVASEGDLSKYSKEFKEYLVVLCMPEWVFNLPF